VTGTDPLRLSAVVVAHDEADQLADCLACLAPADELVVVLDRCTDGSKAIADRMADQVIEGAWPLEGERRNTGLAAATGDWILEVDADERVPAELFTEIRSVIGLSKPGYYLISFDNYIGDKLVKYGWGGSWGVGAAPRLSSPGAKRWGNQRVHPALTLAGPKRWLTTPIAHYVDRDFNDMLDRLKRYTDAKAADMLDSDEPLPAMRSTLRRSVGRFLKCYVQRRGYREGTWGFTIALMAALYPLISHLKAALENDR